MNKAALFCCRLNGFKHDKISNQKLFRISSKNCILTRNNLHATLFLKELILSWLLGARRLEARESGESPEQLPLLYVLEPVFRSASWSLGKPEKAGIQVWGVSAPEDTSQKTDDGKFRTFSCFLWEAVRINAGKTAAAKGIFAAADFFKVNDEEKNHEKKKRLFGAVFVVSLGFRCIDNSL